MRKRRSKSIQSSIFSFTAILIVVLTSAAMLFYYVTMSKGFVENYISSSQQLTKILTSQLDTLVRNTDILQRRLLESEALREYVFDDLPLSEEKNIYIKQKEFDNLIYQVAGYDYPFHHLSILTVDRYLVSFGQRYGFELLEDFSSQKENVAAAVEKRGHLVLRDLNSPKIEGSQPSISLMRAFSRYPLNQPKAVIEIQLSYHMLEDAIEQMLESYNNLSSQVVVMDKEGKLIYPLTLENNAIEHYFHLVEQEASLNPTTGKKEIATYQTSSYTDWKTVLVTPYEAVVRNTREYLVLAVLIGLIAASLLLFLAYHIAKNISAPIITMKDSIEALELQTLGENSPPIRSEYNELELLSEAFHVMEDRLQRSLDDYVALRSLSIESQVLALQSQINPHFLYNTLSIITILAEENEDYQVAEMGQKLVGMLRYSSRDYFRTTIGQELEHAQNYAELMEVRFGEKMQFDFLIDPALSAVETPSIIIQPLIENCVKYAGEGKNGKLIIVTVGEVTGNYWVIQVSDNGKGFSQEVIEKFQQATDIKGTTEEIITKEQTGIGLANIYRRLHLFYGGDSIFKVDNSEYGAIVTIGGLLEGGKLP